MLLNAYLWRKKTQSRLDREGVQSKQKSIARNKLVCAQEWVLIVCQREWKSQARKEITNDRSLQYTVLLRSILLRRM